MMWRIGRGKRNARLLEIRSVIGWLCQACLRALCNDNWIDGQQFCRAVNMEIKGICEDNGKEWKGKCRQISKPQYEIAAILTLTAKMAIFGLIICFGSSVPSLDWVNAFKVATIKAVAIISKACMLTNEISPIYNTSPNTFIQYFLQLSYGSGKADCAAQEPCLLFKHDRCFLEDKVVSNGMVEVKSERSGGKHYMKQKLHTFSCCPYGTSSLSQADSRQTSVNAKCYCWEMVGNLRFTWQKLPYTALFLQKGLNKCCGLFFFPKAKGEFLHQKQQNRKIPILPPTSANILSQCLFFPQVEGKVCESMTSAFRLFLFSAGSGRCCNLFTSLPKDKPYLTGIVARHEVKLQ